LQTRLSRERPARCATRETLFPAYADRHSGRSVALREVDSNSDHCCSRFAAARPLAEEIDPARSSYLNPVRILAMRECISSKEAQPFPWPNSSHANQSGSVENRAKYAKPQIALCGARSLKRNGEKSGARNERCAEGVQKLSSVRSGRCSRKLYQPSSVIAIVPSTALTLGPQRNDSQDRPDRWPR
jgi:hypothetical protein